MSATAIETTAPSEELLVRDLARAVARREIAPHAALRDREGSWPPEAIATLAELGFMGMLTPERHGGLGLPFTAVVGVLEELARADASLALAVAIQNGPVPDLLLRHGSEEQRSRWLPPLAAGECLAGLSLPETGAGDDPAAATLVARPAGEDWILSGRRKWVMNGGRADLMLVFAKTGEDDRGRSRLGAFLVETAAPGYRTGSRARTMGLCAVEMVEVYLDDLRVGADALIGDPSGGLHYARDALDSARIGVGAQAVGIAAAALAHTIRHARERHQFGRPIAQFGAIRGRIATMAARIAAARALVGESARIWQSERGDQLHEDAPLTGPPILHPSSEPDTDPAPSLAAQAAMAKLVASETAMETTEEAVRIFGGYGFMREYPVERLMRDAKATELYQGTSETLRMTIGRSLAP